MWTGRAPRGTAETHIGGKEDTPRARSCLFGNRKAETDRRKNLRNRNDRFRLSFRIRARGHYNRAKPIIRSGPYMMQSGTVFKPNAFLGPDHPVGVICLIGVDPGIDGQNRSTRWRVETNLPCSRPQPSVAPATRRRRIFVRLRGPLLPPSAPLYQFGLKAGSPPKARPKRLAAPACCFTRAFCCPIRLGSDAYRVRHHVPFLLR